MDLVDFSTWWREFLVEARVRDAKDGGFGAVKEVTRYAAGLPPDLRAELVSELAGIACARSEGWGLALGALEANCTEQTFNRIASHASSLRVSTDLEDQSAVSSFLRVLAKSTDRNHRDMLAEYLLVGPLGPYWSSVPWAVWPDDPDLFARSWTRYFTTVPIDTWRDTAIVQAFPSCPDALICVRDALRAVDAAAWDGLRGAVLRQIDSRWLSDSDRQRVRFVCEGAG